MKEFFNTWALMLLIFVSMAESTLFANTGDFAHVLRVVAMWFVMLPPVLSWWHRFKVEVITAISSMVLIATSIHFGEIWEAIMWSIVLICSSTFAYRIWRHDHI